MQRTFSLTFRIFVFKRFPIYDLEVEQNNEDFGSTMEVVLVFDGIIEIMYGPMTLCFIEHTRSGRYVC